MKQKLFNELIDSIKEAGRELKMAPICVNCQIKMTFPRSGVYVLETYEDGVNPYKVWSADLYVCKECGHQVITGFGQNPIKEQFEDGFAEWITKCEFRFR